MELDGSAAFGVSTGAVMRGASLQWFNTVYPRSPPAGKRIFLKEKCVFPFLLL